ncbi:hypothetical protein [Amycolatopsis sp. FDAARGOS 1241]|uniref:hypothetical protein n=1 Tax=Amycolatopsis sp. FDAARGOS 1241 TaxID=2778070 RepID=UPI00194FE4FD|nr:hypothetical protein [Amycolatopsis sp. FDAARGOS 1241]QRP50089.1 hypothetical protein I6J71_21665 [Amycolatopsis sp. FDAARGOS 1241]
MSTLVGPLILLGGLGLVTLLIHLAARWLDGHAYDPAASQAAGAADALDVPAPPHRVRRIPPPAQARRDDFPDGTARPRAERSGGHGDRIGRTDSVSRATTGPSPARDHPVPSRDQFPVGGRPVLPGE